VGTFVNGAWRCPYEGCESFIGFIGELEDGQEVERTCPGCHRSVILRFQGEEVVALTKEEVKK